VRVCGEETNQRRPSNASRAPPPAVGANKTELEEGGVPQFPLRLGTPILFRRHPDPSIRKMYPDNPAPYVSSRDGFRLNVHCTRQAHLIPLGLGRMEPQRPLSKIY
jgi:hypothetical protein